MSAAAYPNYNPSFPQRSDCKYDASKATTAKVNKYVAANSGDIAMMKQALTHQPITAAMNGNIRSFQLYESGVLDDETCSAEVNHSVTIVGYGSVEGEDYWIVKNSWGANWGDKGYFKIAIKPGTGICGIQSFAQWPILV